MNSPSRQQSNAASTTPRTQTDAERAEQELRALARPLQADHPGAAASLREGLEETLTVTRLGLSPSLLRTFRTTNPIESMISVARAVTGNVKRWRDGSMILRWTAAGVLEAGEAVPPGQRPSRPPAAPAGPGADLAHRRRSSRCHGLSPPGLGDPGHGRPPWTSGFHAIPPYRSLDPHEPACCYDSGDYSCVKDEATWWDPSGVPPGDSGAGCYRAAQGGARYSTGKWPLGDVPAQRSASDPCNAYAPGARFNYNVSS